MLFVYKTPNPTPQGMQEKQGPKRSALSKERSKLPRQVMSEKSMQNRVGLSTKDVRRPLIARRHIQRSMYDKSGSLSTTRLTAASSTGSSCSAKLTVFGGGGLTGNTGSDGKGIGTTFFGGEMAGIAGSGVST